MQPVMPQIDTIVMLMLENRSLDTVLGWLYHDQPPANVFPTGSSPAFDGIQAGASNSYKGTAYSPAAGTQAMPQPCRVPRWDPNEPFEHVRTQLFADGDGNMPANPWSTPAPMTGFAYDFHEFYISDTEVMGAYSVAELPVLYGLAQNFAVSDRWFAVGADADQRQPCLLDLWHVPRRRRQRDAGHLRRADGVQRHRLEQVVGRVLAVRRDRRWRSRRRPLLHRRHLPAHRPRGRGW